MLARRTKQIYFLALALLVAATIATFFFAPPGWGTFFIVTIETRILLFPLLNAIVAALLWVLGKRSVSFWVILAGTFGLSFPTLVVYLGFFVESWTRELYEPTNAALVVTWFLSAFAGALAAFTLTKRSMKPVPGGS